MGHRQQMTDKQRLEWDSMQYKARKEAAKGHNYQYLTNELHSKLEALGYKMLVMQNGNTSTHSESTAIGIVHEFRRKFYYARIVCHSNKLRIKEYCVFFKEKKRSAKQIMNDG